MMDPCPVCKTSAKSEPLPNNNNDIVFECPRCGKYTFALSTFTGFTDAIFRDPHTRKAVSAYIREQNGAGGEAVIDRNTVSRQASIPEPGLIERSRKFLLECAKRTKRYQQVTPLDDLPLVALTWSTEPADVASLADLLREQGFLAHVLGGQLTAKGVSEVEAERKRVDLSQAFVVTSFASELTKVYDNAVRPGISAAGYKAFRVDRYDHIKRIGDEIIAQIRKFTGQKAGVYFEAGFAMGLGQHVIWSCRKDDLNNLHFDARQYNFIDGKPKRNLHCGYKDASRR
jgi:hypothetical protein